MRLLLFNMIADGQSAHSLEPICEWLDARGVDYSMFSDEVFKAEQSSEFKRMQASICEFDLVCSFGGDGTTLRAAHIIGTSEVPLLSINFGHLGFLAGAGEGDLFKALEAAVTDKLTSDPRIILEAEVSYCNGSVENHIAFNELVVSRGHFGRIVSLDMAINDNHLDTIRGDGVLIATPTGSTAYSLSAGGPIMAPNHSGLCVVPISPHSLASRAVITTSQDMVEIVPNVDNRQKLVLFIDGEVFWIHPTDGLSGAVAADDERGEIIRVKAGVSKNKLNLRRYGSYDFYTHIAEVFFRGSNAR
ncbi:MAG TPA: hypothetical protein DEB24_07100 [Coriobacteriia bacterium]|nr:hypothetical protein [Coriobacteriia bacterium]